MGSRKPSANAKRKAAFESKLGGPVDDMFAHEKQRMEDAEAKRDKALRERGCESKKRYASRAEAEAAIASCAEYGTLGLHCYRCDYCNGWHLTSKQPPKE